MILGQELSTSGSLHSLHELQHAKPISLSADPSRSDALRHCGLMWHILDVFATCIGCIGVFCSWSPSRSGVVLIGRWVARKLQLCRSKHGTRSSTCATVQQSFQKSSFIIISFLSFHWTLVSSSYLPFYSGRKAQKTELAARCQTFFFEQAVIHFKQNRAIGLSLLEKQDRCFDKNVCVNPA